MEGRVQVHRDAVLASDAQVYRCARVWCVSVVCAWGEVRVCVEGRVQVRRDAVQASDVQVCACVVCMGV